MRRTLRVIGSLAGLVVIGVLLAGLVWVFGGQFGARGQPQVAQQPYPPPATPQLGYPPPSTPPPSPTRIPPTPTINVTPPFPNPILKPVPVPPDILADEKIAFLKDGDLQIINPASRAQARGTTSGNVTHIFGWSHDGRQLLLGVGKRPVPPETDMVGGMDLWVLDVREGEAMQLTQGLEVVSAAWSPVGNQIAYGTRGLDIHLINSDGTSRRKLLTQSYLGPWSPDGAQLVYRKLTENLRVSLSVLDIADGSRRQLTSDEVNFVGYLSWGVQWSLDAQRILFQSRRGEPGSSVWWRINADGENLIHLDNETLRSVRVFSGVAPRSPVTDQVVFSVYDPEFNEIIWTMDFNGHVQELTKGSAPAWSPDGNRIVYMGEDNNIWVINLEGTGATRLSNIAGRPPYHWSR